MIILLGTIAGLIVIGLTAFNPVGTGIGFTLSSVTMTIVVLAYIWLDRWEPEPGEYELCCRARDSAGNEQPVEPEWNLGGYVNNAVQRIPVTVV